MHLFIIKVDYRLSVFSILVNFSVLTSLCFTVWFSCCSNQANPSSLKEFFSRYYVTPRLASLTKNLSRLVLLSLFSHTDSRLLTVAVFLEFTALYRRVQLILIKRRSRGCRERRGLGKGGSVLHSCRSKEGRGGRKWRGECPGSEENSREAGNHEKLKQRRRKKKKKSAGVKVGCQEFVQNNMSLFSQTQRQSRCGSFSHGGDES